MSDPVLDILCALIKGRGEFVRLSHDGAEPAGLGCWRRDDLALWRTAERIAAARPKADAAADAAVRVVLPLALRLHDLVRAALPGLNGGCLSAETIREITELSNRIEGELP